MITGDLGIGLKKMAWPTFLFKGSRADRPEMEWKKAGDPGDPKPPSARFPSAIAHAASGYGEIVETAIELLDADAGYLQLIDKESGAPRMVAHRGLPPEAVDHRGALFPDDDPAQQQAVQSGEMVVVENIEERPPLKPLFLTYGSKPSQCSAFIPLIGSDTKPIGVLSIHFHSRRRLAAVDREEIGGYARLVAVFVEQWSSSERASTSEDEACFRTALEVSELGTWHWSLLDGTMRWNARHYELMGYQAGEVEATCESWGERIHPGDQAMVACEFRKTMQCRGELSFQYRVCLPDGSLRWCSIKGRFFYSGEGLPVRMVAVVEDVTKRKQGEAAARVLTAELQHRSRNLLTVVQSIAMQSMENAKTWEEFQEVFSGRLLSLSRVHDLILRKDSKPITLEGLIRMELDAFCSSGDERITLEGPSVVLTDYVAQALALGLHELTTNALKYGGLSHAQGRLSIVWRIEHRQGIAHLSLEWLETGIRADQNRGEVGRRGYGRTLIEEELPYNLSAQTRFDLGDDTLRCFISIPLE